MSLTYITCVSFKTSKTDDMMAGKVVIKLVRLVEKKITGTNNLRLLKLRSKVKLNKSVCYVIWDHLISSVGENCEQDPFLSKKNYKNAL